MRPNLLGTVVVETKTVDYQRWGENADMFYHRGVEWKRFQNSRRIAGRYKRRTELITTVVIANDGRCISAVRGRRDGFFVDGHRTL